MRSPSVRSTSRTETDGSGSGRRRPGAGSRAACCQWIPGSENEIIWNERSGDGYGSRIYSVDTKESRSLPEAIYTVSPDGKSAIGTDFRRIDHMRPGYGYSGIPDPNFDRLAPDDVGIYSFDLTMGDSRLIVSIAQVAGLPYRHGDISEAKHYFNHLFFNTDGSRFIFLHRWRFDDKGFQTRMMTANADGSGLHVVDDYGRMSHFIWRAPETITDWILNDCYPQGDRREQTLYLYHVPTDRRIDLGCFDAPPEYTSELRCALHPRSSCDGTLVTVDSTHGGNGRQVYLLDVSEVVG